MNICNFNNDYNYELEKLCRIFLPFENIRVINEIKPDTIYAVTELDRRNDITVVSAKLFMGDKTAEHTDEVRNNTENYNKECELCLARQLFFCFSDLTGYTSEWGILTGIRPAKLFSSYVKNYGMEYACNTFKNKYLVSNKKISLCKSTAVSEENIVALSGKKSFSLYISVPFCPTRCSYCSFVSHAIDKAGHLIPEYVDKLCEEILITAGIVNKLNLRLETVYMGGGTPTTLSAEQLTRIIDTVNSNFDTKYVREFTVEAGRPDTVTKEKLSAIKNGGATRISINPQTMNDSVLKTIGRNHTSKQTVDAFDMARQIGFDNINTDLIAGLPGDTTQSFKSTVNEILTLSPESVTVHSLSMKRASKLTKNSQLPDFTDGINASEMVDYALQKLCENGIMPYYMYRQSKTVGNLENVGYAKKGYEGYYNVYIMDETHTILACGASAVTKLRQYGGSKIERIFNYKYPYEYISGFDELIKRKEGIVAFYDKYGVND